MRSLVLLNLLKSDSDCRILMGIDGYYCRQFVSIGSVEQLCSAKSSPQLLTNAKLMQRFNIIQIIKSILTNIMTYTAKSHFGSPKHIHHPSFHGHHWSIARCSPCGQVSQWMLSLGSCLELCCSGLRLSEVSTAVSCSGCEKGRHWHFGAGFFHLRTLDVFLSFLVDI